MESESSQIRPFREGVELNLGLLIKGRNKIVELEGRQSMGFRWKCNVEGVGDLHDKYTIVYSKDSIFVGF